jgi:hypothetical protein
MSKRPLRSHGTLQSVEDGWIIKIDAAHPSFTDTMPVDVILWDNRAAGKQNEIDEIARIQQLEPEVVALALSAEGSLPAFHILH